MKPKSAFLTALLLLIMVTLAFSAGTPAGTVISNFATGDYKDLNGNALPRVTSNTVTTTVTQVAGVDISPPTSSANFPTLSSVTFSLEVNNTGNGTDSYTLGTSTTVTGTGDYLVEVFHDIDGNGLINGPDSVVATITSLAADAVFDLVIEVTDITVGGAPANDVASVTLTATSAFDTNTSDSSILTATVSAATITVSLDVDNATPKPGEVITYAVCGVNTGSGTAYNTVIVGPIPSNTTYVPGSMRIGGSDYASAAPLTDAAGDFVIVSPDTSTGDYNVSNPGAVTILWGDAPPTAAGCVFYQVVINDGVPVNTEIKNNGVTVTYENDEGTAYPTENVSGPGQTVIVAQIYAVLVGDDLTNFANPGDYVTYPVAITNTGNGPDIISVTYTSTYWSWEIHSDFDGDGEVDVDDVVLTDTNGDGILDVGTLAANGVAYLIIAQTQVPAGTGDGTVNVLTLTAKSVGDPTASDQGVCTTTVIAPTLSLSKSVSPTGSQPPGTVLTYRVDVLNGGSGIATDILVNDAIPTNTTYVVGSMTLAGSVKTDANDGDGGTHGATSVTFEIP